MTKLPRINGRLGRLAFAAISVLGALALSSTSALALSATTTSESASVSAQARTLAYWTPARMAAAKNADVVAGKSAAGLRSSGAESPGGSPGAVAGSAPGGVSVATAALPTGQPVIAVDQPWPYPFPYDTFEIPPELYNIKLLKHYPYDVNGTIFFTNNKVNYKCSGTSVVNGHQASEVWTAGHCVASTEGITGFDTKAVFIPAYHNGFYPFGKFVANGYTTATEWINKRDLSVDFGVMTVNGNEKYATLSGAVGTDGFAWNYGANEQFVQFGYPGESPYNGESLQENIAATGESINVGGVGGEPTGTGSPFTGGASGGAWNIGWTVLGPGYINGHTDFYYTERPLTKYSPYFNTLANEVRCLGNPSAC